MIGDEMGTHYLHGSASLSEFHVSNIYGGFEQHHEFENAQREDNSYRVTTPLSFRFQHRFLDDVFNSNPNPEEISGKQLDLISQQVNLPMKEVLLWIEDEKCRRLKAEAQFQLRQDIHKSFPPSPWSSSSPGTSNKRGVDPKRKACLNDDFLMPKNPTSCFSPASSTTTLQPINTERKRGRHPKTRFHSSPPPPSKRHKAPSTLYPCIDCKRSFPAERWPEHVKRVHFPDFVWECPKSNCHASAKPFFRPDNFGTHLKAEHECSKTEIFDLKQSCRFQVFGFFHKVCGFCDQVLKGREESSEHIKEHLRDISEREVVPRDLGFSEWREKCECEHVLKRGVHYRLEGQGNEDDEDGEFYREDLREISSGKKDRASCFDTHDSEDLFLGNNGSFSDKSFDFLNFEHGFHGNQNITLKEATSEIFESVTSLFSSTPKTRPQWQRIQTVRETLEDSDFLPSFPTSPYHPVDSYFADETYREKGSCPYPDCGRTFKDLKAHLLTHQDERPYKCPIDTCEYHTKGFARIYDKNRHALTHYKGEMRCAFCRGKTFNRADVFKRHLTSVHGVEMYLANSRGDAAEDTRRKESSSDGDGKCSDCSVVFSSAQEFYEHLDACVLAVVKLDSGSEAINPRIRTVLEDIVECQPRESSFAGLDNWKYGTRNDSITREEEESSHTDHITSGNISGSKSRAEFPDHHSNSIKFATSPWKEQISPRCSESGHEIFSLDAPNSRQILPVDTVDTTSPENNPKSHVNNTLLRRRRSQRLRVSCTECRRRKQKCNFREEHSSGPCTNCARRFPPAPCYVQEFEGEE